MDVILIALQKNEVIFYPANFIKSYTRKRQRALSFLCSNYVTHFVFSHFPRNFPKYFTTKEYVGFKHRYFSNKAEGKIQSSSVTKL